MLGWMFLAFWACGALAGLEYCPSAFPIFKGELNAACVAVSLYIANWLPGVTGLESCAAGPSGELCDGYIGKESFRASFSTVPVIEFYRFRKAVVGLMSFRFSTVLPSL